MYLERTDFPDRRDNSVHPVKKVPSAHLASRVSARKEKGESLVWATRDRKVLKATQGRVYLG